MSNQSGYPTSAYRKACHESVRIVADNAEEYCVANSGQIKRFADAADGPMFPPFPQMWIEWKCIDPLDPQVISIAVLAGYVDNDHRTLYLGPTLVDTALGIASNSAVGRMRLNDDGSSTYIETRPEHQTFAAGWLPAITALAWINCRNLGLEEREPTERQRRTRQKRGQFPGLDYRVIEVLRSHRNQWEKASGGVSASRFHTVRGNLATYTDERPMFGIPGRTGTYWRPAHARGNPTLGTINHEYHVTSEAAQ